MVTVLGIGFSLSSVLVWILVFVLINSLGTYFGICSSYCLGLGFCLGFSFGLYLSLGLSLDLGLGIGLGFCPELSLGHCLVIGLEAR